MTRFKSPMWAFVRGIDGRRWLNWFVTVAVVVTAGVFLLPVLRRNPEAVHAYFASAPEWQRRLAIFAAVISLVFILFKLLSPRFAHIRLAHAAVGPPMWSAWIVAATVLCAVDLTIGLGPADFQASALEWAAYCGGSILLVVGYRFFSAPREAATSPQAPVAEIPLKMLVQDWPMLENWLRNEQTAEVDLIGNCRIARRLAAFLLARSGTVGVVGPFGSGKSSVVNWLKGEVEKSQGHVRPNVWFCTQSCWGFEDSSAAVQQILKQAVERVTKHADCFSIASLPESYRKTFSVGGDWLRNTADLVLGSTDPMEQFEQLNKILLRLNARLIFVIEDLDRNTSSRFDRQEVLALLQRFRDFDQMSFVLTTGNPLVRDIDVEKLCDHIEFLPEFDADGIAFIIKAVRSRCLESFPHERTGPAEDPWDPMQSLLLSRYDHMPLITASARLLRTPRGLKHALRRTYQAWERLYGEVDFDHLLAVNILLHSAFEAFQFLRRHWNQLNDNPQEWTSDRNQLPQIRKRLRREWLRATSDAEWDSRAALELIVFLLPPAGDYLRKRKGSDNSRSQGIGISRYWHRIVNEEIDPTHVRDQKVLSDLGQWLRTRDSSSPLVQGLCGVEDYACVWEHYAPRILYQDRTLILLLADHVLAHLRTVRGVRSSELDLHPAFVVTWRHANRTVDRNDATRDWLERQIRLAMPVSLSLVVDLYYYWASPRNGIIRLEDRVPLRHLIYELARSQFQNSSDLFRVIHPEIPYLVYQLVFPPETDDWPSDFMGVDHWKWLGPILMDALRQEPYQFARQISYLISQRRDGQPVGVTVVFTAKELLVGFFGSQASEVVQLIAEERDRTDGQDRDYLDQVVRSAEICLRNS